MTDIHPDQHLAPAAAAKFIGRAEKTLRNWRLNKAGPPFYKTSGRITYTVRDLTEWMAQHRHSTGA